MSAVSWDTSHITTKQLCNHFGGHSKTCCVKLQLLIQSCIWLECRLREYHCIVAIVKHLGLISRWGTLQVFIYKIPSFFSNRIYLQKKNKLQQKSKVMTMTGLYSWKIRQKFIWQTFDLGGFSCISVTLTVYLCCTCAMFVILVV